MVMSGIQASLFIHVSIRCTSIVLPALAFSLLALPRNTHRIDTATTAWCCWHSFLSRTAVLLRGVILTVIRTHDEEKKVPPYIYTPCLVIITTVSPRNGVFPFYVVVTAGNGVPILETGLETGGPVPSRDPGRAVPIAGVTPLTLPPTAAAS